MEEEVWREITTNSTIEQDGGLLLYDQIQSGPSIDGPAGAFNFPMLISPVPVPSTMLDLNLGSALPCLNPCNHNDHRAGYSRPTVEITHRRHNRLIKNRESAARSRARKQAYRDALELKVANLISENEKLKIELQKIERFSASRSSELPTKKTLHGACTAPF